MSCLDLSFFSSVLQISVSNQHGFRRLTFQRKHEVVKRILVLFVGLLIILLCIRVNGEFDDRNSLLCCSLVEYTVH